MHVVHYPTLVRTEVIWQTSVNSLTRGWLFFTKQTILIASSFSGMLSGSGGSVGSKSFWATVSWADSKACYKWKQRKSTHRQRSYNKTDLFTFNSGWSGNKSEAKFLSGHRFLLHRLFLFSIWQFQLWKDYYQQFISVFPQEILKVETFLFGT